jgi:hypothetical protein
LQLRNWEKLEIEQINEPTSPELAIGPATVSHDEGNVNTTTFVYTVTRTGDLSQASAVDWSVTGSGANAADFGGVLPSGTATFLANQATATITILVQGDQQIEPDEQFTVTLTNPTNATLTQATALGVIINDDQPPPPPPELAIGPATVAHEEGNVNTTAFVYTVTRTGDLSQASAVDWAVTGSGANAANAADFGGVLPSGTATFLANQATATITILVQGDQQIEFDEQFTVTLANPVNGTITQASAVGVIVNDDLPPPPPPELAIGPATVSHEEGNVNTTALVYTVTRTGDLSQASVVDWAVTGSGTNAANAADFGGVLPFGIATFLANQATATITILVQGDQQIEPDEQFTVTLANPTNATLTQATALGVIINDDQPQSLPTLSIADAQVTEGGTLSFSVTSTLADQNSPISATYTITFPDGATAADLPPNTPLTGQVLIPAGRTSATIQVPTADDQLFEGNETFTVTLSGLSPNVLAGDLQAIGTILDNEAFQFECGYTWGDPHYVTADGLKYDMQGCGEFIFVETSNANDPNPVMVQTRTALYAPNVSVNTHGRGHVGRWSSGHDQHAG